MKTLPTISTYLKAIQDETRRQILTLLKKGPLCVCDILPTIEIPQNLASHHLKVLKDCSLITSERCGTKIIYARNESIIKKCQKQLKNIIE